MSYNSSSKEQRKEFDVEEFSPTYTNLTLTSSEITTELHNKNNKTFLTLLE